ncbi:hypothetical protein CYMTET_46706, partial [Cymbomonas tetramitiformis]
GALADGGLPDVALAGAGLPGGALAGAGMPDDALAGAALLGEASGEAEPEAAAQAPTVVFVEDMDSGDSAKFSSYLGKLPRYTCTKDEDRPKFVQDFVVMCETVRR